MVQLLFTSISIIANNSTIAGISANASTSTIVSTVAILSTSTWGHFWSYSANQAGQYNA